SAHRGHDPIPTRRSSDLAKWVTGCWENDELGEEKSTPSLALMISQHKGINFHDRKHRANRTTKAASESSRGTQERKGERLPWLRSEEHTSELQSRFDLVC